MNLKTYLYLCLFAQSLIPIAPAFAGAARKSPAVESLCKTQLTTPAANGVVTVNFGFFDSVDVLVIKPDPNGTALNRIAHDLERIWGARVATLNTKQQKMVGFTAAWDTTQKVLILPEPSGPNEALPAEALHLIAHEARHMFFKMLETKGRSTIFSGSAGQSLEELFTFPLSIRIAKGETRLDVTEKFLKNILYAESEDQKFPGHAADEILRRFFSGETPQWSFIARSILDGSTSLTFESKAAGQRDNIRLEVLKAYGRQYVKVTVQSLANYKQAGLIMDFPAADAAGYLKDLSAQMDKAPSNPFGTRAWQEFFERVSDRIKIINEIQIRSLDLANQIETQLHAGQSADKPSSNLIQLVRRYAKIPVTPLN